MKLLERFSLIVFSIIIIFVSVIMILIGLEVVNADTFEFLTENIIGTICVSIIFILWAIANIFLRNTNNDNSNGVLLENENGSLLITKDFITNLTEAILRKNSDIKEGNAKISFDMNKDLIININATVKDTAIVKETSTKIQENIKMTIKKATDLDVREINIKIKNVGQDKKVNG